jgi:DtxR family transcriptional regulator, Mn-dependent transcriptional regulator
MVQQAQHTSEAEEMYLITIARAVEEGHSEPIPVSLAARKLAVSGVSANQMIRKLAGRGYVEYEPYQGATLTDAGRVVASSILRRRRLWGVFLTEQLGLTPERADEIACDLEHITPDDVANLLSGYLGDPALGPRGRSIPGADVGTSQPEAERLGAVPAGERRVVAAVDLPQQTRAFVGAQGIAPGTAVEVLGVGAAGDRLIDIGGATVHLSLHVTSGIVVESI